jgi:D-alanyl-D-alanine carboxypeptidase
VRLLLLLLVSQLAFAGPLPADRLAARLDAAIAPLFKHDEPGGAVILTREGRWIFRQGYGLADRDSSAAITSGMPFRIGSVTKPLTATAIFRLADEGKLSLEDEVGRFFPDYPAHGRRVTIAQLLAHSTGIPSYSDGVIEPSVFAIDKTVAEIMDEFTKEPLRFEPGEALAYSNSNYFLLGAIIEKVSGKRYADAMAERIFEPLGMHTTAYEGFERDGRKRVEGYVRGRNKPFEKAPVISMTQPFAAGALVSSVEDLAKWGEAIDRKQLLSADSWKRMFRPFVLRDGRVTSMAHGWSIDRRTFERDVYFHAGGIDGFQAFVMWAPQDRIFIAVLVNDAGRNPARIALTMLHIALQQD